MGRVAVAAQAPGHTQRLVLRDHVHFIDLAVTAYATDTTVYMRRVVIKDVIRGAMKLNPLDRLAGPERHDAQLPNGRGSVSCEFKIKTPVTQEKSKNSPRLFSKLVWSAGLCGLPQFDRISLRVMHAGKPAGGIGRVNLDLDSCSP